MSYKKEVELLHNEIAAKVNKETGEVTEVRHYHNNIPKGKQVFDNGNFFKGYPKALRFLETVLTDKELVVVLKMCNRTEMNTNSLHPLSDDLPVKELARELNVHRNHVKKIIERLRYFGVFLSYQYINQYGKEVDAWILSPYISFKGKLISTEIIHLFNDTILGKVCQE